MKRYSAYLTGDDWKAQLEKIEAFSNQRYIRIAECYHETPETNGNKFIEMIVNTKTCNNEIEGVITTSRKALPDSFIAKRLTKSIEQNMIVLDDVRA
jgi:hypothetical protein